MKRILPKKKSTFVKSFTLFLGIIFSCQFVYGQLPDCNKFYLMYGGAGTIYTVDPVTNTVTLNSITPPSGANGLAVAKNFFQPSPSPTFYTVVNSQFWYYNGSTWVNTGNSAGSSAAVNPGGSDLYIYNMDGVNGEIYQYDGTGNATPFLTIQAFPGPFDLVGDGNGNMYFLKNYAAPQQIQKYDPSGNLICTYSIVGLPTSGAGAGFAIVNGMVFVKCNSTVYKGIISGSTITFTLYTAINAYYFGDMASCPLSGVQISGNDSVCVGDTIMLSGNNGTWSSSDTAIATVDTSGIVTGISPGIDTITYTGSGSGFGVCSSTIGTLVVKVLTTPNAGILSGNQTICAGSTTQLSSSGDSIGVWSSNNTSIATVSSSGLVTGVSAGTATIYYNINDACGNDSATLSVTVITSPNAGILNGNQTICVGSTTQLTSNGDSTGTWSTNNSGVATVNSSGLVTGISSGTDTIQYIVTSSNCGNDTTILAVTVIALPNAGNLSGSQTVCIGSTDQLTSNGDSTGTWSSSNTSVATVSSSGLVTTLSLGTTTITYYVSNICGNDSATLTVTVVALPNAGILSGNQTICVGSTTQFISDGDSTGIWSSNNIGVATVNSSGLVTGISAGTATINYYVSNACGNDSAMLMVTVTPAPNASFGSNPNPPIKPGDTIRFTSTSTDAYSYLWESNDGQSDTDSIATFKYSAPGTYSVCLTVTNIYGCEDSACENIEVQDDFFMPNVITPNGDGINDVLFIKGLPIKGNNAITIYDRWGKKIYHSDNYKNDWGGTNKGGKKLSDGTYYYILLLGNDKKQTGYITILN